jgi:ABC-type phosphate transport system permease subunit
MYDRGSSLFLLVLGLFGALIGYLMLHLIGSPVGGLIGIGAGIFIMWLDDKQ